MDQTLGFIDKYWKLITTAGWLIIGGLVLFADYRYVKADYHHQIQTTLEDRIKALEIQTQVTNAHLAAISAAQGRMLDKLDRIATH